jgi:hypothetical protein
MNRYNLLSELCISKGCKIITTEQEFNNMDRRDKINIISKCGHISNDIFIDGLKRNQYILCKDCVLKNHINFNNNNSLFNTMQIEADSIKIIKEALITIILEKNVEGCKGDVFIKPNKIEENKWLSIQIKSTIKKNKNGYYCFSFHKNNYENNIIICVAIEEKKIWIMDNNIINGINKIACGASESKYNQYEVKIEDLNKALKKFYKEYTSYHNTKENLNIPISKTQKKEHQYRLLRKSKINYLKFIEPEINNTTFDFTINNYKIQEKVAYIAVYSKKNVIYNYYIASFRKRNGKKANKTYDAKDNDYYWINLENINKFLLIPDEKMIEKKLVNVENKKECILSMPINIDASHWLYDYLYDYEKDNKEKLLELFKINNTR